jgi:hypothetical protein
MSGENSMQSADGGAGAGRSTPLREILSDAIAYWEPRRIPYNLVLTAVVLAWIIFSWPHFQPAFTPQSALFLFVLATLANVCYCAAYLADVPMQYSLFQAIWRRWRWSLWLLGMIFAIAFTNYWIADEIYPYVG